jgi:hypothetical protein
VPWCHKILEDSGFKEVSIPTRIPKPTTQSSLFGRTLNTPDAISHCVAVYREPAHENASFSANAQSNASVSELRMLMHLGGAVNGHAHIAHGGFVVLILDEVPTQIIN